MFMGKLDIFDPDFDIRWDNREKCEFASALTIIPAFIENIGPSMMKDLSNAKSNSNNDFDEVTSSTRNTGMKILQKNEFILARIGDSRNNPMEEMFSEDVTEK